MLNPLLSDMIGRRFGKWTVLEFVEYRYDKIAYYTCRCECGLERAVNGYTLISGT
jgi:hypothetical protein